MITQFHTADFGSGSASITETHDSWHLTGCLPGQSAPAKIPITKFPYTIGRAGDNDLEVLSRSVSKHHAAILASDAVVILQDVGSTNGTYLNGKRLSSPAPIGEGDLVQFADVEFRVGRTAQLQPEHTFVADGLEQSWMISRMHDVLNADGLVMYFQPILAGANAEPFAYEALARSRVPGLESPLQLFNTAERLGLETDLSQKCRSEAVRVMNEAGLPGTLFVNTHPHEPLDGELLESLHNLRAEAGDRELVLEIHEQALPNHDQFAAFREELKGLKIQLAYDDFGVGQSRLKELTEAPPDYLKFDRSLVHDLGSARAVHANLVRTLHNHARELGIATVAEGLETDASFAACREIGFTHYQGFLFSRPKPIRELL